MNTWYHIVGVFDGTRIRYYVNGILDGEEIVPEGFQGTNLLDNGNLGTRIGGSPTQPTWSDQHINGLIDEVRFYDRALSDSEIQTLYEGTAPELSISPLSIDFDGVSVGETSTEQVTVTNSGTAQLIVSSIAITGADSLNFGVDTTTFTLTPGDSTVLDIIFTPDDTGNFNASLYIDSDGGSVSVALAGNGVNTAPLIISITDVPDDQGRWVYLSWIASVFDTLGEITQYGVWELNPDSGWVSLGQAPSVQADKYTFLARTFGDSTVNGVFWSKFKVTAHSTDPLVYYTSTVDSGYSIDNLAPSIITGLRMSITEENAVKLSWDASVDEDFNYFKIYRNTEPGFDPTGMDPFEVTIDTIFTDREAEVGKTYFYRLSAVDFSGNESDYSEAVSAMVVSVAEISGIPTEYTLAQNYPNPFNPRTTIKYQIPQTAEVTLEVYDLLGRDVRTLVNREHIAGFYLVEWDGRDENGNLVASGLYFYALRVENTFLFRRKMLLLK